MLRYVHGSGEIHEVFTGFVQVEGASQRGLARLIKSTLTDLGLSLADCRGQGYDGAAAMQGKFHVHELYAGDLGRLQAYLGQLAGSVRAPAVLDFNQRFAYKLVLDRGPPTFPWPAPGPPLRQPAARRRSTQPR